MKKAGSTPAPIMLVRTNNRAHLSAFADCISPTIQSITDYHIVCAAAEAQAWSDHGGHRRSELT